MAVYDSSSIYIESATTLCEKIVRIDEVILALESTMLKAAAGDGVTEYMVDNGQSKVKTITRSVEAISRSMRGLEQIKQRYINSLNGRVMTLVDGKSFRH